MSPAARTAATAELVLAGMADPPECRFDEALYGADPEEVLAFVRALPDDVAAAMVVGHNPTAHSLSQGLLSARDKKGLSARGPARLPHLRARRVLVRVDRWADVAAGTAKLVALLARPTRRARGVLFGDGAHPLEGLLHAERACRCAGPCGRTACR